MKLRRAIIPFVAFSALMSACHRSDGDDGVRAGRVDTGAAKEQVKRTELGMLDAFHAKDANKLTSYYAADAISAVPGQEMKGSDAISKGNGAAFKDPNFKLDFSNDRTDVASSGDLAYTSGTYQLAYTDPKSKQIVHETGRYLTVFKKQADRSWKAVADFATSTKQSS